MRIGPPPSGLHPNGRRRRPASLTVTEEEMEAFLNGCARGAMGEVEWFLTYRPEQWGCHRGGKTGLMYAAENGHGGIVAKLLHQDYKKHANVNGADKLGITALHYAAKDGKSLCVKILLEHGARTTVADDADMNVLHYAAANGDPETLKLLLPACGDLLETRNCADATPLWLAVMQGKAEAVRLMLDAGARVDTIVDGKTLIDAAKAANCPEVAAMLAEEPARRDKAFSAAIDDGISGGFTVGKAFTLVKKKEPEKKPDKKDPSLRAMTRLAPALAPRLLTPAEKRNFP